MQQLLGVAPANMKFDVPSHIMRFGTHTRTSYVQASKSKTTYVVRLARSVEDLQAIQLLRFLVFNLEMRLGYAETRESFANENTYDSVCEHLLIERNGQVVGTYRLRVLPVGDEIKNCSCGQEFDLSSLTALSDNILELGRACIDRKHRSLETLRLLWRGILDYSIRCKCRYLVGCTSIFTQNQLAVHTLYSKLPERFLSFGEWQILPNKNCECDNRFCTSTQMICSRLLAFYLTMGAKVCGPPAIDKQFRTIDFLTYFDALDIPLRTQRFFAPHQSNDPLH